MAIAYNEWDNRTDTIVAAIKQRILASSDWAHLQLTTGTAATTLSSGASAGATSISTAATIPSGSYIVIGNGAANPEVRLTTAVSGAGPFTVSWVSAEPLVNTYSSGAAVGVGSYVKATTTRGAQMVVDLASTAPTLLTMTMTVYQTHDGTTGVAPIVRWLSWKRLTGLATYILHARVSAAKDWLYFDVEGPRSSETGADSASAGSFRQCFSLGDVVPYDVGDTTPCVALVGSLNSTVGDTNSIMRVSRNRDNNGSWVPAQLRTLSYPQYSLDNTNHVFTAVAKNGDYVQSPIIVVETGDGLRGRLQYLHHGGIATIVTATTDIPPPPAGAEMIYGAYKYRAFYAFRVDGTSSTSYGFGSVGNGNASNYAITPIVWVPVAAYP